MNRSCIDYTIFTCANNDGRVLVIQVFFQIGDATLSGVLIRAQFAFCDKTVNFFKIQPKFAALRHVVKIKQVCKKRYVNKLMT